MGAQASGGEKLGKGNLTLIDVIAQSIGFIGPVFAAAFFIPTIVGASLNGKGAGIASPVRPHCAGGRAAAATSGTAPKPPQKPSTCQRR